MPLLPGLIDTGSISQIAQAIAALPVTEANSWLLTLRKKPGMQYVDWARAVAAACETGNVETELLRQGLLWQTSQAPGAVAAQSSQASLFNPTGSGLHFLVFLLLAHPSVASGIRMATQSADTALTAAAASSLFNLKVDSLFNTAKAVVRAGNNAAFLGANQDLDNRIGGNAMPPTIFTDPGVALLDLAPGTGVAMFDTTVNDGCRFTFRWAELPINASI